MFGSFSEDALSKYEELILRSKPQEFSESDSAIYDFTRCVRPNGTAYGTRGKCRKGTEEAPAASRSDGAGAKTQEGKVKEWYDKRKATLGKMKGWSKKDVLAELDKHRKIHSMTEKDSLVDLKSAVLDAVHGNREPGEMSPRMKAIMEAKAAREKERGE